MGVRVSRGALAAAIGVCGALAHSAVLVIVAASGDGLAGREVESDALVDRVSAGLTKGDGDWYIRIATSGYPDPDDPASEPPIEAFAFFPLLPLLLRAGLQIGLPPQVTGWLVGLVAAGIATWAITAVADTWSRTSTTSVPGLTAAFLWAFAPGAIVFPFPMTDTLFTALAAVTLLLVLRNHWWGVAGVGALAALTRPTGLALAVALAVVAGHALLRKRPWHGPALSAVAVAAAAAFWPLVVGVRLNAPWTGYLDLQRTEWNSGWDLGSRALTQAVEFVRDGTAVDAPFIALNVAAAVAAVVALVLLVRLRPPLILSVYSIAATVLVLGARGYLVAKMRFLVPVFPLWYVPARWVARLDDRSRITVLVGWAILGLVSTHRTLSVWAPAF